MKKLILAILIFFAAGSLMAQPVPPTIDIITSVDTITYILPIYMYSAELSTISIRPPTSFQIQIEVTNNQIKKKSPQARDLKAQISQLIAIGTAMYIWRDELIEFSNWHDKWAHGMLAFGLTKYFGWRFAIGFMLSVELTQADDFGITGRYKDTAGDMLANAIGIGLAWRF